MTADLLREVGEALYGPLWQSELARQRDIGLRRVQRMAAGESPVPVGVWAELRGDLQERQREIAALIRKLPR